MCDIELRVPLASKAPYSVSLLSLLSLTGNCIYITCTLLYSPHTFLLTFRGGGEMRVSFVLHTPRMPEREEIWPEGEGEGEETDRNAKKKERKKEKERPFFPERIK